MWRLALATLRRIGTTRAVTLANEIERGARRAEPASVPGIGGVHEYGTVDQSLPCRHCGYPSAWRCFTCDKPLCFECVRAHGPARVYVGSR